MHGIKEVLLFLHQDWLFDFYTIEKYLEIDNIIKFKKVII